MTMLLAFPVAGYAQDDNDDEVVVCQVSVV